MITCWHKSKIVTFCRISFIDLIELNMRQALPERSKEETKITYNCNDKTFRMSSIDFNQVCFDELVSI